MKRQPTVFLLLAALLGAAAPGCALDWLNRFRSAHGLAALAPEAALQRAAGAYAATLAASGRLAHRDPAGRRALGRYRAAGGSAARVGEILGAGPGLAQVAAAWEASPAHAAAALDPRWTRAGVGRARSETGEFWVVLFAEQRVEGFAVTREPAGGYRVTGTFPRPEAAEAVLLSGLVRVAPAAWDPARREFCFILPAAAGGLYHRLGFRTGTGEFSLTSAFYPQLSLTSSPETAPR